MNTEVIDSGRHRTPLLRPIEVVTQPQTYRNLVYSLLGLPLGIAWFVVLITGATIGVSLLVVALIGIPILLGTWYVTRVFANIERRVTNALLGSQLSTVPMLGPSGNPWQRLSGMSAESDRRREVGFLLARLPIGIGTFALAVTLVVASMTVAYAPIHARISNVAFGTWFMSDSLQNVASQGWAWLLIPLGVVGFIASLHAINGVVGVVGRWTVKMLDSHGE